jgi:hypothetical protein
MENVNAAVAGRRTDFIIMLVDELEHGPHTDSSCEEGGRYVVCRDVALFKRLQPNSGSYFSLSCLRKRL